MDESGAKCDNGDERLKLPFAVPVGSSSRRKAFGSHFSYSWSSDGIQTQQGRSWGEERKGWY